MSSQPVRVAVCGALGKMGLEVVKTVLSDSGLVLAGLADSQGKERPVIELTNGLVQSEALVYTKLEAMLDAEKPEVCVDFTHPSVVFANTMMLIQAGCRPVVGTTGLSQAQLGEIDQALKAQSLGGIVAPNFALGAVLMMKFAQEAAKYFDHAEIIELHHNQKADAPSGTAIKTAELMSAVRKQFGVTNGAEKEIIEGSRGGNGPSDIKIHSVRLPGYVAHQEVLFGSQGQVLTLRHDSIDRTSFMPGVALACKHVMGLNGLVYGLENVL